MRAIDVRFALMLFVLACLSGCSGNPAPQGWRLPAVTAQQSPHGGWIAIETAAPAGSAGAKSGAGPIVKGELIAVDQTAFNVLTIAGLQAVPLSSSLRITIVGYSPSVGGLAGWATAGGISTLSHGGFLILTAPMWTVAGIAASHFEKHAGVSHDADRARAFARFPQGLPPGFDPKSLGPLPSNIRTDTEKAKAP